MSRTSHDTQMALGIEDVWYPLPNGDRLSTSVRVDSTTAQAAGAFDLDWTGETSFLPPARPPELPADYGVGVIVGASGSGKTTLLRTFGEPATPSWGETSIASHFSTPEEVAERFYAVGLNSVPTWVKPYSVLSTGERFRADLARSIQDGAAIDEYTSVVDRTVAVSASNALRRHVEHRGLRRIVIATCHRDVLPWLQPDWVMDLDIRCWALRPRECLQRPELVVEVHEARRDAWRVFAPYHYLSADMHPFARCYIATINDSLAAFAAVLPFPNGHLKNAYRGHRTVVLPDYQGLGIGMHLSDWIGGQMLAMGRRYYSKTAHPRMIAYREASPFWRRVSKAKPTNPTDVRFGFRGPDYPQKIASRIAMSHEYVGSSQ
jgi:ABC-type transport system involved in cytochrome c biogenesis ATPase subunit